ncbi:hypothetical protein HYV82_06220 [Candidatus Woesearchaeota archaeon]|nr:hypothetical protein [Candidatus Woesearchaeota archaeon]
MIYMLMFWATLALMLIARFVIKKYYTRIEANDVSFMLIVLASSFLIVGIAKNDPLFSGLGVPLEFEWVVGVFISGLSSWKLYFNPMERRITKLEIGQSKMRTDIAGIKSDVHLIKERLMRV